MKKKLITQESPLFNKFSLKNFLNMKNIYNNIRLIILSAVLLVMMGNYANSQGTDSRMTSGKKESLYFGLYANPLMTSIYNKEFASDLNSKNVNTINLEIDFGYFFSKIFGISFGAGYGSFSSELSLDTYSVNFADTDSESESYEMQITGRSIIENQKISLLSIPVYINFRIPANDKLGFLIKGGASFDIPMNTTYEGSGIFTYKGYYSAYPVTIENYPAYFPTDFNTSSSGTLLVKSMNISLVASGSAFYSLGDNSQLLIGLYFHKSMTDISSYEPDTNFRLTSRKNELNSFMEGSSSVGIQAIGISVGFKYYLK